MLQRPFSGSATNKINLLLGDGRATELYSNLRFFKARYESILANMKTEADEFFPNIGTYDQSRAHYYIYIEQQLAEVNDHLAVYHERTRQMHEDRYMEAVPNDRSDSK